MPQHHAALRTVASARTELPRLAPLGMAALFAGQGPRDAFA
jgi:hypothetical protein